MTIATDDPCRVEWNVGRCRNRGAGRNSGLEHGEIIGGLGAGEGEKAPPQGIEGGEGAWHARVQSPAKRGLEEFEALIRAASSCNEVLHEKRRGEAGFMPAWRLPKLCIAVFVL